MTPDPVTGRTPTEAERIKAMLAIALKAGEAFMRPDSQDAAAEFRPHFDVAPVGGHGPSLAEYTAQTPLTVGSPARVPDAPTHPGVEVAAAAASGGGAGTGAREAR